MKRTLRPILTGLGFYFFIRALIKTLTRDRKTWLGFKYLIGQGIEIGALNAPLATLPWVKVDYLDRLTAPPLRRQYPELETYPLVPVDILDDGESLKTVKIILRILLSPIIFWNIVKIRSEQSIVNYKF
ncbi:MAG: hypothetical protein BWY24_00866 [Microgenomates group bacterium ADurb.Bin219]|nr:MAG: hypothetical protein BWY24_00866 [Microgenomates group bacterium ADurb.Bin219]HNP89707.1 hypothetical protein [Candidatus Woesebacteria bacterium]